MTINDVTVDDPLSVDQDGNFRFELSGVYDVQPGQTVVVSSNDGITKSHQVLTMGIDNVSIDDDTVTGTAASGSTIFAYASNTLDNEQVRTVVAQDGYWTVDYLDTMDIIPGSGIEISQLDTDGDWTYLGTSVNDPVTPTGTISGVVTDADTDLPIQNIPVWVDRNDMNSYHTCTHEDGRYSFTGLELDREYRIDAVRMMDGNLCAGPDIYALQVFDGTINERSATMVPVTTGVPVATGINFALERGGRISGHVYKSDGITPVVGVQIHLFTEIENGIDVFSWGETGHSDENGFFNFSGVPTGTYFVRTNAANEGGNLDLFDEWYAESGVTPDGSQANPVTITQGVNTTGVNFQLDTGGTISGQVTDGTVKLANIPVELEGDVHGFGTCTDEAGNYQFTAVPFGDRVQGQSGSKWRHLVWRSGELCAAVVGWCIYLGRRNTGYPDYRNDGTREHQLYASRRWNYLRCCDRRSDWARDTKYPHQPGWTGVRRGNLYVVRWQLFHPWTGPDHGMECARHAGGK